MPILAIVGIVLIVLALIHKIPFVVGLVLGVLCLAFTGWGYYSWGRGNRPPD